MADWHLGEMLAFDTETTAPDPLDARLVTACTALVHGAGKAEPAIHSWLIDPGVEIPAGATEIHGITTEHARANGVPPVEAAEAIAAELESAWSEGLPVIGHNVVYDLTVLNAELVRHGLTALDVTGPVVDTMLLDKHVDKYRKGKRTLTRCAEVYSVPLDGAHDATFDALASARIAWRICRRYPAIAAMSLAELHDAQVGWAAEQAASLADYFRRTGKTAEAATVDGAWPVRYVPVAVA